jgi:prefoldin alpha subunit
MAEGDPNQQKQQELMFKLQMYEQHMNQLQQQMQAVEQGVTDLTELIIGLEELKGKEGQEIRAQIGKGIFVKAKLSSEDLLVDIGNKTIVTKSIDETKDLIEEQLVKLNQAKEELNSNLEKIQNEMMSLLQEAQGQISSHEHSENCECEEDCGKECKHKK